MRLSCVKENTKQNKGFTLTEVIGSMVVLAVIFAGVFVSFMSLQKINVRSDKLQMENNLATSLSEGFYDVSYDKIVSTTVDKVLNIPSNFNTDSMVTAYNTDTTSKQITLQGIKGRISNYNATITLTPILDPTGNGFSDFTTTAQKNTIVLNTNRVSADMSSYDDMALEEFLVRNKSLMQQKYNEDCAKVDELNEKYGLNTPYPDFDSDDYVGSTTETIANNTNVTLNVEYYQEMGTFHVSCYLDYVVENPLEYFIDESNGTYKQSIFVDKTMSSLSNVIVMFPKTVCKSETIKVKNGLTDEGSAVKSNLYISYSMFSGSLDYIDNKDAQYNLGNLSFDYSQSSTDLTKTELYTNVADILNSASADTIVNKHAQIFEAEKLKNRLYEVDVKVIETSTNTFDEEKRTVLVLEYEK